MNRDPADWPAVALVTLVTLAVLALIAIGVFL